MVAAPVRTAKKEETRHRLLEAALSLVAEKGFANASVAEIAARAGVTTGAVYSNFRSKEALLLALANWMAREAPTGPAGAPPDDTGKPLIEQLVDQALAVARFIDTAGSRRLAVVQLELFHLALRDRTVRREVRASSRRLTNQLARVLEDLGDVPNPGPPPSVEQLADACYACLSGLQQIRLLLPEFAPDELFEWAVRALLFAASEGVKLTPSRRAARRDPSR